MYKSKYGFRDKGGWKTDHIWSLNSSNVTMGANTNTKYVQSLSYYSNDKKANEIQGKINSITFAIKKTTLSNGRVVEKMKININTKWQWTYKIN